MKPIVRSIKYFTRIAEEYFLCLLVICILLFGLQTLGSDRSTYIMKSLLAAFPYQLFTYTAILALTLPVVIQLQLVPLILCFNTTRKHTFWGTHWALLLFLAQTILLSVLLCLVFKNDVSDDYLFLLPALIGILTGCCGIGFLLAGAAGRFNKAGLWIMMLLCGLFGGTLGLIFGAASDVEDASRSASFISRLSGLRILPFGIPVPCDFRVVILAIGIILYLIGFGFHYLMIRKIAARS